MNTPLENPWAARFLSILDRDEIIQRATLVPVPLGDISKLPVEIAALKLKAKLESVYFPTDQCVDTIPPLTPPTAEM